MTSNSSSIVALAKMADLVTVTIARSSQTKQEALTFPSHQITMEPAYLRIDFVEEKSSRAFRFFQYFIIEIGTKKAPIFSSWRKLSLFHCPCAHQNLPRPLASCMVPHKQALLDANTAPQKY